MKLIFSIILFTCSQLIHAQTANEVVTEKTIEASNGYYRMGDFIGISGVEKTYEKELGGRKGVR